MTNYIPFGAGASAFATSSAFYFTTGTSLLTVTNASSTLLTASYASSTLGNIGSLTLPTLGTPAGTFLAVNASGLVIATTTPAGGTYTATYPITLAGSAFGFIGLSTSTTAVIGNIPYFSGANTLANVATSTPTVTAPITYSGTLGSFVGGAAGAFDCTSASGSVKGCLTAANWTKF